MGQLIIMESYRVDLCKNVFLGGKLWGYMTEVDVNNTLLNGIKKRIRSLTGQTYNGFK